MQNYGRYYDGCIDGVRYRVDTKTGTMLHYCTGNNNTCMTLVKKNKTINGASFRLCHKCAKLHEHKVCKNPNCQRPLRKGHEFCYKCDLDKKEEHKNSMKIHMQEKRMNEKLQMAILEAAEFSTSIRNKD